MGGPPSSGKVFLSPVHECGSHDRTRPALAFLPPVVAVLESPVLSVTPTLSIAFFALLVIRNGAAGAVSDVKSICPKPFSYCEGLLIEKDSQTIEAECVLYSALILQGKCARSHQKD